MAAEEVAQEEETKLVRSRDMSSAGATYNEVSTGALWVAPEELCVASATDVRRVYDAASCLASDHKASESEEVQVN